MGEPTIGNIAIMVVVGWLVGSIAGMGSAFLWFRGSKKELHAMQEALDKRMDGLMLTLSANVHKLEQLNHTLSMELNTLMVCHKHIEETLIRIEEALDKRLEAVTDKLEQLLARRP